MIRTPVATWLNRLSKASDLVAACVARLSDEWAPEDPPVTVIAAEIGHTLVVRSSEFSDAQLRDIFLAVEDVLTIGTESDKDAVATGLLEAVLAAGDEHPAQRARALSFAGPESRAYCRAWDSFTGSSG